MEKLIELLNKYNIELHGVDRAYKDGFDLAYEQEYMRDFRVAYLISKKFGFIKRLVENDKIDFSLIPNKIKEIGIPMKINGEIKYGFDSSDYYWLLMLLSIQDNPIEFLISVLK